MSNKTEHKHKNKLINKVKALMIRQNNLHVMILKSEFEISPSTYTPRRLHARQLTHKTYNNEQQNSTRTKNRLIIKLIK